MIATPGYHEISMADYLADPCPEPALSSQIVAALWKSTAQRAKLQHPRLNKKANDFSPRADIGSAVHALAHGGYPVQYVESVTKRSGKEAGVPFIPEDWATQDAKDARDAIRAAGGIPLLPKDRMGVAAAAGAIQAALAELGPGRHEQTLLFQFEGVWCRGRADWLSDGPVHIPDRGDGSFAIEAPNGVDADTKTVDVADAATWVQRTLYSGALDVQIGLRHLGHIALGAAPRKMLWLLAEYEHPYDTCWVGASEEVIELAVRKVRHAAKKWRQCLDSQKFPANSRAINWASPPTWALWELENRGVP